jgi:hypothetical protein
MICVTTWYVPKCTGPIIPELTDVLCVTSPPATNLMVTDTPSWAIMHRLEPLVLGSFDWAFWFGSGP